NGSAIPRLGLTRIVRVNFGGPIKMKKLFGLFAIVALSASLTAVGCSSDPDPTDLGGAGGASGGAGTGGSGTGGKGTGGGSTGGASSGGQGGGAGEGGAGGEGGEGGAS